MIDDLLTSEVPKEETVDTHEAGLEERTEVDEKLNGMEKRLRLEMNARFQNIQTILSSLTLSNGQASNEINMNYDREEMSDSSEEDVELRRSPSQSSLSNKSTKELKVKFEIIMKEMKAELKNLNDAVKKEKSVSAMKVGIDYLKSKEKRCSRLIDKYAGLDAEEKELNNLIEQWLSIQDECREIRTEAENYLYQKRKKMI